MTEPPRFRVLRVIARLNVGGPAHHVTLLTNRLDPRRFETLLLYGDVGPGERELEFTIGGGTARAARLRTLGPELRPASDARAVGAVVRALRAYRPHILHTHTAKAGMVARSAAILAGHPRPLVVHTYHGHVLEGYFGPARSRVYQSIERGLATGSDALLGVSQATVDDLVRLGVAPRSRFRVLPVGLDLEKFARDGQEGRERFRASIGVERHQVLVGYWGRLVPIKRIDVLLDAFATARARWPGLRLALAGDGDLRPALERRAAEAGLGESVSFLGYRTDVVDLAAATDIAALSSDNEGTPVSLIEAGAAARPSVATAVGGVPDIITDRTGFLAPAGGSGELADGLVRLAKDPSLRSGMGQAARALVMERYSVSRLVANIEELYCALLATRPLYRA